MERRDAATCSDVARFPFFLMPCYFQRARRFIEGDFWLMFIVHELHSAIGATGSSRMNSLLTAMRKL